MRRLLLLTFTLCVTLLVLSLVSVGFGRAQAAPVIADGLGWCEDRPCYLGIVPGKTSWREATTMLAAKPGTVRANEVYTQADVSPRIVLWHATEREITLTIQFLPFARPAIGTLILFSGQPCRVRYYNNEYWLDYPNMTIATSKPSKSLPDSAAFDPHWPVSLMQITSTSHECTTQTARPWQGFTSLRSYDPDPR
jgi:hypothetical protein